MSDNIVCGNCGDSIHVDDAYMPQDAYDFMCYSCIDECITCGYYFVDVCEHRDMYCANCGGYYCPESDMYYCDDCDSSQCGYCGECRSCSVDGVRNYSWNPPEFNFHGSGNMFGIEIEVGGNRRTIVDIVHAYDNSEEFVYMKEDASVDGVEIVSHPMSLEFVRTRFDYAGMLAELRRAGCYVDADCGLHIHVGRDAFRNAAGKNSAVHLYRWLKFLNDNSVDIDQAIAHRVSDRWAPWNVRYSDSLRSKAMNRATGDSRYAAVNTTNAHTIELRVCASTFDAGRFYAAVEFMHASIEYTRQLSTGAGDALDWFAFGVYVATRATEYPSLAAVVGSRLAA